MLGWAEARWGGPEAGQGRGRNLEGSKMFMGKGRWGLRHCMEKGRWGVWKTGTRVMYGEGYWEGLEFMVLIWGGTLRGAEI